MKRLPLSYHFNHKKCQCVSQIYDDSFKKITLLLSHLNNKSLISLNIQPMFTFSHCLTNFFSLFVQIRIQTGSKIAIGSYALKSLFLITRFPFYPLFKTFFYLSKKLDWLFYNVSHSLEFVDYIPLVSFTLYPPSTYRK